MEEIILVFEDRTATITEEELRAFAEEIESILVEVNEDGTQER